MMYQTEPAATAIMPTAPIATRIFFMCLSGSRSLETVIHGARAACAGRGTPWALSAEERGNSTHFERAGKGRAARRGVRDGETGMPKGGAGTGWAKRNPPLVFAALFAALLGRSQTVPIEH